MKWLLVSNSPNVPSGYGQQTRYLSRRMQQDPAFDPMVFAFYGQEGHPARNEDGVLILPRAKDGYGNDIVEAHCQYHKIDITFTLIDPWVMNPGVYKKLNWAAWVPVDSQPAYPKTVKSLQSARWVIAMSRFGERELRKAGFHEVLYMPHGVDSTVFRPMNRAEARGKLANFAKRPIPDDAYLVVMVAANKGFPSRKNFAGAFEAFSRIVSDTNAYLYCHTDADGLMNGEDLHSLAKHLGIHDRVIFPSQYEYIVGGIGAEMLNNAYNAGDVYLNLVMGGGFEIPNIEAQLAGCPIVTTDATAPAELVFAGEKVPAKPFMRAPDMWGFLADIDAAEAALRHLYAERGNEALRQRARNGAMQYDMQRVWEQHMRPTLEYIERDHREQTEGRLQRSRQRLTMRALATSKQKRAIKQDIGEALSAKHQHMALSPNGTHKAPVAFCIFNRPDLTAQSFARIRDYQPTQLFIIADGARNDDEREAVEKARAVACAVDWPCDVRWNFATVNMGVEERISTGMDWVFTQVDRAIMLEDDLVPHPDFFPFMTAMLNRYADDDDVQMVSGFNYAGKQDAPTSYRFTRYGASWGWATWRRAWAHYDHYMTDLDAKQATIRDVFRHDPKQADYFQRIGSQTLFWRSWAYRWCYARTVAGISILPTRNLVENRGYVPNSTHASKRMHSEFAQMQTYPMDAPLKHPDNKTIDLALDKELFDVLMKDEAA